MDGLFHGKSILLKWMITRSPWYPVIGKLVFLYPIFVQLLELYFAHRLTVTFSARGLRTRSPDFTKVLSIDGWTFCSLSTCAFSQVRSSKMQKSSYYMLLPGFQLCQWIGLRRLRENYRLYPHGYLETASWWRCSIRRRMVSTSMICLGFLYVFPGWWSTYPSDIYEFVSWDDEIPNLWKVIIHSCSEPPTSIAICKTYKSLLASISYMATLFLWPI